MTRRKFDELRKTIDADPVRRERVDRIKSALGDVLALAELRAHRKVTQQELATLLEVTQANVSRVEHQDDLYLSTLRSYIEAMGGRLELRAVFPDVSVELEIGSRRRS